MAKLEALEIKIEGWPEVAALFRAAGIRIAELEEILAEFAGILDALEQSGKKCSPDDVINFQKFPAGYLIEARRILLKGRENVE